MAAVLFLHLSDLVAFPPVSDSEILLPRPTRTCAATKPPKLLAKAQKNHIVYSYLKLYTVHVSVFVYTAY